jgi:porphobilinogen synthase
MRRLRAAPWLRELVAEHSVQAQDLVWPVFVAEGSGQSVAVEGLSGVSRYSVDVLVQEVARAAELGIRAVAIFPAVDVADKSDDAHEALNPDNLVCRAIRALKQALPQVGIIADVALDPYTLHGHDGIVSATGDVDNDLTVDVLCAQAVMLAKAGADIVAPSDMMDGRVRAIRVALEEAELTHVVILSYAAKYASALYSPFREAVGSKQALGKADKRTYQMNPANGREAEMEVQIDIAEGSDMVMVKPGLHYLDILYRVAKESTVPVAVYHVSGEYAMLKAAAERGLVDEQAVLMETMLAFKRAGAAFILSYAARDVAALLQRAV